MNEKYPPIRVVINQSTKFLIGWLILIVGTVASLLAAKLYSWEFSPFLLIITSSVAAIFFYSALGEELGGIEDER